MCQSNKFIEGRIVYFTQLQSVAVIGHCCADNENNRVAEAQYRYEQRIERAENELLDFLPRAGAAHATASQLVAPIQAAERVHSDFRRRGGYYMKALRKALKQSDVLTVDEVIDRSKSIGPAGMRSAGSTVETRSVQFGILEGKVVVASTFKHSLKLDSALKLYSKFSDVDEDATLEKLLSLTSEEKIQLWHEIEEAQKDIEKCRKILTDFRAFFKAENLSVITSWGQHPDNPTRMTASIRRSQLYDNQIYFEMSKGKTHLGILIDESLGLNI